MGQVVTMTGRTRARTVLIVLLQILAGTAVMALGAWGFAATGWPAFR